MNLIGRRELVMAGVAGWVPAAWGQSDAVLRLVVGFPPGGSVDVAARHLADALRADGVSTIVENRPGAAGKLAIDAVKAATPDGRTLLLMPNSILTMEESIHAQARFDVFRDFVPVSPVSQNAQGLAVGPATPARSLKEFLAWAQANTDKASYATPGQGTPFQFLGQALAQYSGVSLLHVPYRGGAPAVTDTLSGQVPAMIGALPVLIPHHASGRLRLLAVSSPARLAMAPDVPTFAEQGFPGLGDVEQFGLFAPAATPMDVVNRLAAQVARAVQTPALRDAYARVAFEAASDTPDAYRARLQAERRRWGILLRQIGHKPQ